MALLKVEMILEYYDEGHNDAWLNLKRNSGERYNPNSISSSFRGAEGEAILHRMDLMGICISTGSACDSVHTQLSHVISAINVPEEYARGTIRISLGKHNTEEDVKKLPKP